MRLALIEIEEGLGEPRLGLAYLAAFIRKYSKYSNQFIILNGRMDITSQLKRFKPDLIGMSAVSHDFAKVNKFAKGLKLFRVPLIIGGVHITTLPEDFDKSEFDIAVIGEGEQTLLELCELINSKRYSPKNLKKIAGILFRSGREVIRNKTRELIADLDKIPHPDRDLLNLKEYWLRPSMGGTPSLSILTARGCPYKCAFCSSSLFWKSYRFNSAEYVVEEIKELYQKYRIGKIVISDDLFIANKQRVDKIIKLLRGDGLLGKIQFHVTGRANLIDEEICKKLKELNTTGIDFGLESGSQRVLRYLKGENVNVSDNYSALALCKKYGLKTGGFFVIGSPIESEDDLKKTEKLLRDKNLDEAMVYHILPYPGTKIWDYAIKRGVIKSDLFNKEIKFTGFRREIVLTEHITADKLERWYKRLNGIAEAKSYKKRQMSIKEIFNFLSQGGMEKIKRHWKKIPSEVLKIIKYKLLR